MGAQPPFGPADLAAPPRPGPEFVRSLRQQKQERYPSLPPFYEALCAGELGRDELQAWVKDQYTYWDHGVVYSTGAIFAKTNDEATRTHILRRLVDIEGEDVVHDLSGSSTPAWEELWLRLGEGLGVSREEVGLARPFTHTAFTVSTLCTYSRYWDWSWLDGIATFYAADLYGQEAFTQVNKALDRHYGITEPHREFFRVYLEDVASHIPWEEEALAYWACSTERQLTAARAFRERLDIEHQLLVGLDRQRTEPRLAFVVP